jgi:hypothetical protein
VRTACLTRYRMFEPSRPAIAVGRIRGSADGTPSAMPEPPAAVPGPDSPFVVLLMYSDFQTDQPLNGGIDLVARL